MKTRTRRLRKKSGGSEPTDPTGLPAQTSQTGPNPFAAPPVPTNTPPPPIPGRPPQQQLQPVPAQETQSAETTEKKPGVFANLFNSNFG